MVAALLLRRRGPINAFTVAFQIPNLVRALVADAALSSAFVPVFSELLEKGERKRAWRVASTLFWLMLLGLSALSALFILARRSSSPVRHPDDRDLAVGLSRVLFPIVALLGVSGIVVGILNSYDHFTSRRSRRCSGTSRSSRGSCSASRRRRRRRRALHLRRLDPRRDRDPGVPADTRGSAAATGGCGS